MQRQREKREEKIDVPEGEREIFGAFDLFFFFLLCFCTEVCERESRKGGNFVFLFTFFWRDLVSLVLF